jgi:hypothetical protein
MFYACLARPLQLASVTVDSVQRVMHTRGTRFHPMERVVAALIPAEPLAARHLTCLDWRVEQDRGLWSELEWSPGERGGTEWPPCQRARRSHYQFCACFGLRSHVKFWTSAGPEWVGNVRKEQLNLSS